MSLRPRRCCACGGELPASSNGRPSVAGTLRGLWGRVAGFFARRAPADRVVLLAADRIEPNPFQPRLHVDPKELHSLAASIRSFGVIVPILVREDRDRYVLIAGQRRLAACKLLGMERVPALVRRMTQEAAVEAGFLENLHRAALKPVEEARVVDRLSLEWGRPKRAEVAGRLGMDAAYADDIAELLDQPVLLREAMVLGLIGPEHARLLASERDRGKVLSTIRRIHRERLSPQDTRKLMSA